MLAEYNSTSAQTSCKGRYTPWMSRISFRRAVAESGRSSINLWLNARRAFTTTCAIGALGDPITAEDGNEKPPVKALRKICTLKHDNFIAWVYTIVRGMCTNEWLARIKIDYVT